MFGFGSRLERARRARHGWVAVHRSLPLPTTGVPDPDTLLAAAEAHAERLVAAGAVDQYNAHAVDDLFDELFHDARVALRSAADAQRAVEDRLVDRARTAWVAASGRLAVAAEDVTRREQLVDLHYRHLTGLPADRPAPAELTALREAG